MFYRAFKGETGFEIPEEFRTAVKRADDLEELIQNNALEALILSGVERVTERDVHALRGLWRGRNRAREEDRPKD